MDTEPILWTDAIESLLAEGFNRNKVYKALGDLLDGELDLPQVDDTERVISQAEFERARENASS